MTDQDDRVWGPPVDATQARRERTKHKILRLTNLIIVDIDRLLIALTTEAEDVDELQLAIVRSARSDIHKFQEMLSIDPSE
jgi:hypothetical protein